MSAASPYPSGSKRLVSGCSFTRRSICGTGASAAMRRRSVARQSSTSPRRPPDWARRSRRHSSFTLMASRSTISSSTSIRGTATRSASCRRGFLLRLPSLHIFRERPASSSFFGLLRHSVCADDRIRARPPDAALFEGVFDLKAPSRAPYLAHVRQSASRPERKSPALRGLCRALFRTRTGDPLLTMEVLRQRVATGRNGFRLFLRLPRLLDLPTIAAVCNHGAP
jgi:hypothetical protein